MIIFLLSLSTAMGSLKVLNPQTLIDEYPNGFESSLGSFGNPPYNSKIIGFLWYPSVDQDGCSPITFIPEGLEMDHYIFMFDRGNCSYSLKVKHAQDVGVKAVIIANTNENEKITNIIMRDNGMGGNLFIPAMMISKEDADRLKKELKTSTVTLKLGFELPQTPEITLSLVLSSGNEESQEFMKSFYDVGKVLTHYTVNLEIHYVVIQCIACKNRGFDKEEENCLGGGRYCAPDPDDLINGGLSGRDVIQEDLRQMCLLETIKKINSDFSYDNFFAYLKKFSELCSTKLNDKKCSEGLIKEFGFDLGGVKKCVSDSFGSGNVNLAANKYLDKEIEFWHSNGLHVYPAVMINHYLYRGDLETSALMTAICAGYYKKNLPEFCRDVVESNVIEGYNTSTVVFGLILFFGILVAVLVVYRHVAKKELEREMRKQVNSAVNQYIALNDISNNKVIERQSVRSSYV